MFKKTFLLAALLSFISIGVAHAGSDKVTIGSDATIEETEAFDSAVVIGGDLTVNGTINEDTVVIGGNLNVGPTGKLNGDTVIIFGKLIKADGSFVSEDVTQVFPFGKNSDKPWKFHHKFCCFAPILGLGLGAIGLFGLVVIIGFLAIVFLVTSIFTAKIGRTSYYIERFPGKSILYGILAMIFFIPITILLAVSIVGLPLVPLFIAIYFAAAVFGYVVVCQLIGKKFFKTLKKPGKSMIWEVLVGFVILFAISLIPVIGWVAKAIAWVIGLGGTLSTRFGFSNK